jgi:hypothetical protein
VPASGKPGGNIWALQLLVIWVILLGGWGAGFGKVVAGFVPRNFLIFLLQNRLNLSLG